MKSLESDRDGSPSWSWLAVAHHHAYIWASTLLDPDLDPAWSIIDRSGQHAAVREVSPLHKCRARDLGLVCRSVRGQPLVVSPGFIHLPSPFIAFVLSLGLMHTIHHYWHIVHATLYIYVSSFPNDLKKSTQIPYIDPNASMAPEQVILLASHAFKSRSVTLTILLVPVPKLGTRRPVQANRNHIFLISLGSHT